MNSYYLKYLKYKNKYLKIKDQIGGDREAIVRHNGENITLSFPERFFCPITRTLFVDPVILEDGYSYERNHIEEWIKNKGTSPITLDIISNKTLTPNEKLKTEIQQFISDGYQRLKKQTRVSQPFEARGARAVGSDDGFSVVSASDDFSVVSRNHEQVDLPIGKIPLPWKKPSAPPFTPGMGAQERREYYAARARENDAYKRSPALRIYEDLFGKTNSLFSTPLGGTSTAELYASAPITDPDAVTKYLAVILYCYQILQWGATHYTSQYKSLDELPIDARVKQEHLQRLRVAAQLASLKLDSLHVSYADYFAPKTVALMRGLFR